MITDKDVKNKDMGEPQKQEFHFAGTPDYYPQTVLASSLSEAEKNWLKTREPIKKPEAEKVVNQNKIINK